MRDDRRSLDHVGADSGGVVGVMMTVDVVADRLIGNQSLGFRDVGERAALGYGRFDRYYKILELHYLTVGVGRSRKVPDTVGKLLRFDFRGLRRSRHSNLGHRSV